MAEYYLAIPGAIVYVAPHMNLSIGTEESQWDLQTVPKITDLQLVGISTRRTLATI